MICREYPDVQCSGVPNHFLTTDFTEGTEINGTPHDVLFCPRIKQISTNGLRDFTLDERIHRQSNDPLENEYMDSPMENEYMDAPMENES